MDDAQFDESLLLNPQDPPATVMDRDTLVQAVEEGVKARVSYCDFVSHNHEFYTELLPRLGPVLKFNKVRVLSSFVFTYFDLIKVLTTVIFFWQEAAAARISFVPDLRYVRETRPVEEMVDLAPEAEQHVIRAMLAHVSSVSVES